MAPRDALTAEQLRHVLDYDPDTGVFTWRVNSSNRAPAGSVAGNLDSKGYQRIGVLGHQYRSQRLAWLHVHGKWPDGEIDHKNNNPLDNRIENLRDCTSQQNKANRGKNKNNATGLKGVYLVKDSKTKPYGAAITVDRRSISLGKFSTAEEAHAAYEAAARKHFGDFARAH
jgi:hypothetical protein